MQKSLTRMARRTSVIVPGCCVFETCVSEHRKFAQEGESAGVDRCLLTVCRDTVAREICD